LRHADRARTLAAMPDIYHDFPITAPLERVYEAVARLDV
jgi:hypothetical protein